MRSTATAIGMGVAASLGFARNVVVFGFLAAGSAVASVLAQGAWRERPLVAAIGALGLFAAAGVVVLLARPSWNDYIVGRPLLLAWPTVGVFAATTTIIARLAAAARLGGTRRATRPPEA